MSENTGSNQFEDTDYQHVSRLTDRLLEDLTRALEPTSGSQAGPQSPAQVPAPLVRRRRPRERSLSAQSGALDLVLGSDDGAPIPIPTTQRTLEPADDFTGLGGAWRRLCEAPLWIVAGGGGLALMLAVMSGVMGNALPQSRADLHAGPVKVVPLPAVNGEPRAVQAVAGVPTEIVRTRRVPFGNAAMVPPAAEPGAPAEFIAGTGSPPTVAQLLTEARRLVGVGDIASARGVLARAVGGGDAGALFALAETFDPNMLAAWDARGQSGDVGTARQLYGRALAAGVAQAKARLQALD